MILFTGGGCLVPGGVPGPGGSGPGGCLVETPQTATAAGGTHPTGMHSCCKYWNLVYSQQDQDGRPSDLLTV